MTKRSHRVGTITCGFVLVGFGLLFLLRMFYPALNYQFILSLWPVVLILLGLEMLFSYFIGGDETLRYDGGAIFLVIVLAVFSMMMAGAEVILRELPNLYLYF